MPILNNLGNNFHFLEVLLGILGGWLPLGRLWRVGQPKKFIIVCLTRGLVKQSLVDLLPWSTKNVLHEPPWSPLGSILGPSGAHFEVFLMTLRDNMDL